MAVTPSPVAVVGFSPAAVTQLTERQFPHAGVPEIVNCRSASYVTSGICGKLHAHQICNAAAWLQGNAQVTISGTPA